MYNYYIIRYSLILIINMQLNIIIRNNYYTENNTYSSHCVPRTVLGVESYCVGARLSPFWHETIKTGIFSVLQIHSNS